MRARQFSRTLNLLGLFKPHAGADSDHTAPPAFLERSDNVRGAA